MIFGLPLVLGFGILNFILIAFQVATGRRWVKVDMKWHRRSGVLLGVSGVIHGVLAILASS